MRIHGVAIGLLTAVLAAGVSGCDASAGMELAASDLGDRIAENLSTAVDEYHAEVDAADDYKESAVASAFVARVLEHSGDAKALGDDQQKFLAAMQKVRRAREIEFERRAMTRESIGLIREMAGKLRKIATDSMSLSDEARRYVTGWIDQYQQVKQKKAAEQTAAIDQRRTQAAEVWNFVSGTVLPAAGVKLPVVGPTVPTPGGTQ